MRRAAAPFALVLTLLFVGAGCASSSSGTIAAPGRTPVTRSNAPRAVRFSTKEELALGETVMFPDGLTMKLVYIADSRCPQGVQCIWAGELAPTFRFAGGTLPAQEDDTLGTVRASEKTIGDYRVTLAGGTATSMGVVVSKLTVK